MALGTITRRLVDLAEAYERRGDDDAWNELRAFGQALETIGGPVFVTSIYDKTIDRFGWRALPGVAECWRDIGGWQP
ncbi:hypothetical protein [Sphingomonas pokkalii]|uniref:Uncharacterized protein n=1 Tax=Sphingomonas pokkalii TaxID=2175090 RepID=A0A2U0SDH8_9SPHN|nr:hypothetical protein [Sphingomonas pokkalii]PVX29335.1 hypothetical protein DD559_08395 [Sphingomonas pokkalii]